MNFLADNLALLCQEMSSIKLELKVLRQDKESSHSDSWLQLLGAHNNSRLNNVQNKFVSISPPRPAAVFQQMWLQPVIPQQTVLVTLH